MTQRSDAPRVFHYAVFVSIIAFLLGTIVLLVSYHNLNPPNPPTLITEVLRDLGIVLCSIGLISLLYEMLIRQQLLADYNAALQAILDPDTRKLGVRALFRDRDDKSARGRSLDAVLRVTRRELLCFGLGCYQFLPEKREVLLSKVREGCSFRFLIFNPASKHATSLDESLGYGSGTLINFLHAQQSYFVEFMNTIEAEALSDKVEVRMYDVVPTFGALVVDRSGPAGYLIVELYGRRVEGSVCPGMELIPQGSDWYLFYDRQIAELWRTGKPLVLPAKSMPEAAPS